VDPKSNIKGAFCEKIRKIVLLNPENQKLKCPKFEPPYLGEGGRYRNAVNGV
jgi:hypothetical protein